MPYMRQYLLPGVENYFAIHLEHFAVGPVAEATGLLHGVFNDGTGVKLYDAEGNLVEIPTYVCKDSRNLDCMRGDEGCMCDDEGKTHFLHTYRYYV